MTRVVLIAPYGAWSFGLLERLEAMELDVALWDQPSESMRQLVASPALLADPPEILIADLQGDEKTEASWALQRLGVETCASAWAKAHPSLPIVILSDRRKKEALLSIVEGDLFGHLIPRSTPEAADEVIQIVERLTGPAIFGYPERLIDDHTPRSLEVTSSRQKDGLIDALDAYMREFGLKPRIADAVRQVADEFVINAVFNAPVDAEGSPRFRSQDRRQPVELGQAEAARFGFGCNGSVMAISIADRFGSLYARTVQEALCRSLAGGSEQIEQKAGGAGLGLFFILENAHKVFINISPGRKTEFVALFYLGGGFRAFAARPKSLHVFVR